MAAPRPRQWVSESSMWDSCTVDAKEMKKALAEARRDILAGKKPVPAKTRPHLLITIGAPGAGKSTVADKAVDATNYVVIDIDVAVKYHPRYQNVWSAPDVVTGKPTGVGFTTTYMTCNDGLDDMMERIFYDLISAKGPRYNIILQSHAQGHLIDAKSVGYRVTLLFVGVPLEVATQRSRERALKTGKFLAPTLAAQDKIVEKMWSQYLQMAVWFGMWADEFLVANNGGRLARTAQTIQVVPLHCGGEKSWDDQVRAAEIIVDAACGLKS